MIEISVHWRCALVYNVCGQRLEYMYLMLAIYPTICYPPELLMAGKKAWPVRWPYDYDVLLTCNVFTVGPIGHNTNLDPRQMRPARIRQPI